MNHEQNSNSIAASAIQVEATVQQKAQAAAAQASAFAELVINAFRAARCVHEQGCATAKVRIELGGFEFVTVHLDTKPDCIRVQLDIETNSGTVH